MEEWALFWWKTQYGRRTIFLLCIYICTNHFPISIASNILQSPVEYIKGVGPQKADLLKKELGIFTFKDLLEHYPLRHLDKTKVDKIKELNYNTDYAQVAGKLTYSEILGEKQSKRLVAYLKDDTGQIELVWFQGINWVQKILEAGHQY